MCVFVAKRKIWSKMLKMSCKTSSTNGDFDAEVKPQQQYQQQHQHHSIPKFDVKQIEKGANVVICGRRAVGKSHLTCAILESRRPNAKVVIFTSKYASSYFAKFIKKDCIYDHYDKTILRKLIEAQQAAGPEEELIVAFEDIAVNKDFWEDEYIKDVVRYGSSLGITCIFSIQWAGQLSEVFKRNMDYVFTFHDNDRDNQRVMFDKFAGIFSDFEEFQSTLHGCIAEPYRCLVIDLKTPRKDPKQSTFWYKCEPLEPRPEINANHVQHVQVKEKTFWQKLFSK